jgi:hypothetical protein
MFTSKYRNPCDHRPWELPWCSASAGPARWACMCTSIGNLPQVKIRVMANAFSRASRRKVSRIAEGMGRAAFDRIVVLTLNLTSGLCVCCATFDGWRLFGDTTLLMTRSPPHLLPAVEPRTVRTSKRSWEVTPCSPPAICTAPNTDVRHWIAHLHFLPSMQAWLCMISTLNNRSVGSNYDVDNLAGILPACYAEADSDVRGFVVHA